MSNYTYERTVSGFSQVLAETVVGLNKLTDSKDDLATRLEFRHKMSHMAHVAIPLIDEGKLPKELERKIHGVCDRYMNCAHSPTPDSLPRIRAMLVEIQQTATPY